MVEKLVCFFQNSFLDCGRRDEMVFILNRVNVKSEEEGKGEGEGDFTK